MVEREPSCLLTTLWTAWPSRTSRFKAISSFFSVFQGLAWIGSYLGVWKSSDRGESSLLALHHVRFTYPQHSLLASFPL